MLCPVIKISNRIHGATVLILDNIQHIQYVEGKTQHNTTASVFKTSQPAILTRIHFCLLQFLSLLTAFPGFDVSSFLTTAPAFHALCNLADLHAITMDFKRPCESNSKAEPCVMEIWCISAQTHKEDQLSVTSRAVGIPSARVTLGTALRVPRARVSQKALCKQH